MSQTTKTRPDEREPSDAGEFTVSDELYEISEATNKNGTVDVEIFDFDKDKDDADEVRVKFYTPTMQVRSETMAWPKKDDPKYKFVRICNDTVGGLKGANFIKTDGATIEADPDTWEIVAERGTAISVINHIRSLTMSKIFKGLAITTLILMTAAAILFLVGVLGLGILGLVGLVATPITLVQFVAFTIMSGLATAFGVALMLVEEE